MLPYRRPTAGLVLFVLFLLLSCSGSDTPADTPALAAIAQGCSINTDCNSPLVCAFRKCHTACTTSRDCPPGQNCMASDRPFHVCQLPDETKCAYNSQCPEGQLCGVDGRCRDQCASDRDCVAEQVCTQGTCASPKELTSGGKLPVPVPMNGASDAAATGQPCSFNSECDAPLVCRLGLCAKECLGDRDCPSGQSCTANRCERPDTGTNVTTQPDTGSVNTTPDAGVDASGCSYNSDCPPSLVCRAQICVPECKLSIDCPEGRACVASRCVIVAPDGAQDGYGVSCNHPSDCPIGLVCGKAGQCVFECNVDFDCTQTRGPAFCCLPSTHACVTGLVCRAEGGAPDVSSSPPDGAAPDAARCVSDLGCSDGVLCNGPERCVSGYCLPAVRGACDDNNPCTTDTCSEATKSCTHTATGAPDDDHDGHYDIGCGGDADDCDDNNPDVYVGHAEICDGLDNNCNGIVDEGVWHAGPVKILSPSEAGAGDYPGDAHEPTNLGAPALARLSNGSMLVAAATYPQVGPKTINAVAVTSTLDVSAGPATVITAGIQPLFPTAASDGTGFVVGGATFDSNPGCANKWSARIATVSPNLSSISSSPIATATIGQCVGWYSTITASRPAMAYNGSRYVLAWADGHGDNVFRAYVATMTSAGVMSGAHTVTTTADESIVPAYYMGAFANVQIALGPTTALVAWQGRPPTGPSAGNDVLRYAIMDRDLNGVLQGPFDIGAGGGAYVVTSAAHVGSSFAVALQKTDGNLVTVYTFDDVTGARKTSTNISNGAGGSDVQLIGIHGGFALTISRGTYIGFAWAAEDLKGGIQLQDLFNLGSSNTSSGGMAVIDPTHFAVAWADGQLKGTVVSCGP